MLRNQKLAPATCADDFNDRLVVITGATSGIGSITAKKFASHGADILCINRNEGKSEQFCKSLEDQFGVKCNYILADFSILAEIHAVAKQLAGLERNIDVLIHNAGVYVTKKMLTTDNLELMFQTNYLSTFILNDYTRDKFIDQQSGRIIFVNSEAHRFAVWGLNLDDLAWDKHRFSGLRGYGAAKLAQLLSMIKLNEYFSGSGVTINAMHPGNVVTSSGQTNNWLYRMSKRIFVDSSARPIEISAEALYYLGVSSDLELVSGKFFNLTTEEEPAPPALDKDAAEKLWQLSREMGGLL